MSRPVLFRPEAAAEARESQRWYERRRPGLGAEFVMALRDTVTRVAENQRRSRGWQARQGGLSCNAFRLRSTSASPARRSW